MNKKLKIIYFADIAAEHTLRWVLYFAKLGHEVHVITWNDLSSRYRLDDVENSFNPATLHVICKNRPTSYSHSFGTFFFKYLKWIFLIIKNTRAIFFEVRPDLIHSHSVGSYAWITLFLPKTKIIMTPWGTDILIDMKESIFNRFISLRALHKSSAITVDAEHMKDKLINFGIEPSKIQIIFFGTNTKEYVRIKKERSRIREKYNILETDIVVISTRTLNPIHDVFLTIQSIPLVLNENKNVKFIIASDGSERTQMKEYVANLGISDYVIFPGYMTSPEMVAFLSASDIYVSSSKADAGLSASTAEAMSTGLPVIVSDNSDNRFWVKDSGILLEDGDSQGIADGILSLVDNSGLMETLGSNGKSRILIDNDYETEMNKVNTLYLVEVNKN